MSDTLSFRINQKKYPHLNPSALFRSYLQSDLGIIKLVQYVIPHAVVRRLNSSTILRINFSNDLEQISIININWRYYSSMLSVRLYSSRPTYKLATPSPPKTNQNK